MPERQNRHPKARVDALQRGGRDHRGGRPDHHVIRFTRAAGHDQPVRLQPLGIWIGFDLLVAWLWRGATSLRRVLPLRLETVSLRGPACDSHGFLGTRWWCWPCTTTWAGLAPAVSLHRPAGTTSLLFEVAACVALYLAVLFIEFTPAPWSGWGSSGRAASWSN